LLSVEDQSLIFIKLVQQTLQMADKKVKKMNTKKRFVADGVFQAELNQFLSRTLG